MFSLRTNIFHSNISTYAQASLIGVLTDCSNLEVANVGSGIFNVKECASILSNNRKLKKIIGRIRFTKDTMIGDNGITLSEGQKQKVVIARALLRHAKIYLLDEITANLDIESELQICALLKELKKDGLVINISHRKKILEISDISYELVDGKFIRTSN